MGAVRWTLEQVADFLGISVGETRELVEAGFIHYARLADADTEQFDADHVKEWRGALGDGGRRGAAFLRALLADGVTTQHA
jgi:hypothetical protein